MCEGRTAWDLRSRDFLSLYTGLPVYHRFYCKVRTKYDCNDKVLFVVIDTLPGRWRVVCYTTATFLGGGIRDIPVWSMKKKKYSTKKPWHMWNSHGTFYFTFIHTYVIHTLLSERKKEVRLILKCTWKCMYVHGEGEIVQSWYRTTYVNTLCTIRIVHLHIWYVVGRYVLRSMRSSSVKFFRPRFKSSFHCNMIDSYHSSQLVHLGK